MTPQRLGVALEAADVGSPVVERSLSVVAEGRMPEVVSEARRVDDIGVEPEGRRKLPADLGHLEGVGEAVAGVVGCDGRAQHLRLAGEPAECTRVHDARAIAGEVAATAGVVFREPALGILLRVLALGLNPHCGATPPR